MSGLLSLISKLTTVKIDAFQAGGSDKGFVDKGRKADVHEGANVVCSKRDQTGDWHAVLLDLDIPAYLIPSSTPGHSHLYIDTMIPQERYFRLLDTLVECGIIEAGYASASKQKGSTYLRLPWVKKVASTTVKVLPEPPEAHEGTATVQTKTWNGTAVREFEELPF